MCFKNIFKDRLIELIKIFLEGSCAVWLYNLNVTLKQHKVQNRNLTSLNIFCKDVFKKSYILLFWTLCCCALKVIKNSNTIIYAMYHNINFHKDTHTYTRTHAHTRACVQIAYQLYKEKMNRCVISRTKRMLFPGSVWLVGSNVS